VRLSIMDALPRYRFGAILRLAFCLPQRPFAHRNE
jgi:hypothetical protein